MITEDYVSFETAKLLKEKGFDEKYVDIWYDKSGEMFYKLYHDIVYDWRIRAHEKVFQCPTLQMAMKWLREKEIFVEVTHTLFSSPHKYQYSIFRTEPEFYTTGDEHKSYEEACEAAIKYCLENLI